MSRAVLQARGIGMAYGSRRRPVTALHPTDFTVRAGESVAVVGRSGAGKSTLAEILLGLRRPSAGDVLVHGEHFCGHDRGPRAHLRHLLQGVPQDAGASLPPRVPVRRSIERALLRLGVDGDPRARLARAAETARIDPALLERAPHQLSGGQAQRAAIARAVAVGADVVVADEPTSALDAGTAAGLASALLALPARTGGALLLITHDDALATRCDRVFTVREGKVEQSR